MFLACGSVGDNMLVMDTDDLTVQPVAKRDMSLVKILNYDYRSGRCMSDAALENWVGSGRHGLVCRNGERSWSIGGRKVAYEYGEGGLSVNGVSACKDVVSFAALNCAHLVKDMLVVQFFVRHGSRQWLLKVGMDGTGRVVRVWEH